ncbi:hypothetical protein JCM19037_104 [Geomicrobium sp. JCM 19037]|uniref:hypothetical protein n=1 Tax=unclassified Geomicrobium TaxID=2628951 RepID=UPI00045F2CDE|nr:hypothetical protein [Geomicrobium sp. JCM 19037]GAK01910.1 hypothetical protein JCM19037_104 [Geomicrobium sp. JCM 19037]
MAYIHTRYSSFLEQRTSIRILLKEIHEAAHHTGVTSSEPIIIGAEPISTYVFNGEAHQEFCRVTIDLDRSYDDSQLQKLGEQVTSAITNQLQPVLQTTSLHISVKIVGFSPVFYFSS